MSEQNDNGLVYVLTNPEMQGLVKIGMTTRQSIDIRLKELYTTGVPVPFECAYACEVNASDCVKIEKALHTAFAPNRVNANREFFRISPHQVIAILELFNNKNITQEISTEIENNLTDADIAAMENSKQFRRPVLNFIEMGIPIGSKLVYAKDKSISVVVISDRRICWDGNEYSLTYVTKQLLGITKPRQPTRYWLYDDRNLQDIYNETYTIDE
jgi:hypothetical protein